jgi:transcriptional regulator with AAA-type ATPase domain/tetratricopeptide (TPR) repeat protein
MKGGSSVLSGIVGDDDSIRAIRARAARLLSAERLPPVLIEGETGTGKTLLARELHASSARSKAPFVAINCAAIPETLLESELFGIERGAFTDAHQSKPGLFQAADRGTLFLDEIGYLPVRLQPKLLTAIEEWSVRRLGSTKAEPIDVWLIAATSEDLERAISEQRFLRALYHRLAVMTFRLPALRERAGDVPIIAEKLLASVCRTYGLPRKQLGPDAIAELRRYSWPGNVRELGNIIERAALLGDELELSASMLAIPNEQNEAVASPSARYVKKTTGERSELETALEATGGNISEAARLLGIPRNTLRYRLRRQGLTANSPPSTPSTPVRWERQQVALLSASVADETWLDALEEKIELFGGRILERDSERIIAVFGLGSIEDGARRAVLAGLTSLQTIEPARIDVLVDVADVAIARTQGEVTVGPDALEHGRSLMVPRSETVRGVWLGDAGARAVRRHFGVSSRDGGHFIDAEHSAPTTPRASALVGRNGELELLLSRAEISRAGSGQIVGIVGPPGIGKSRLVEELRGRLSPARFRVVDAGCAAHSSAVAYHPIAQIVRRLGTDGASSEERLHLDHVLGVETSADRFGSIGAEEIRSKAFASVRSLLIRAASAQPLVVIVEDLHWSDPSSRALLDFIVEGMGRAALVLVVTYRPENEPEFMARPFATRIALARLSTDESSHLVRHLLPGEDGSAIAGIVDRAEGNPLFLEELASALKSGEAIASVPGSLQGILRMRMERLAPAERRLLQVASVLGREFPCSVLEALWDEPDPIGPLLGSLDRGDLLFPVGERCSFKHALTRDAAYDTIVESERARLHGLAGRALELAHLGREFEVCELLAYHYGESPEHEKAIQFLLRAQAKSYRRFALEQALSFFRAAEAKLDALPQTEANLRRRIELLITHCDASGYLSRLDDYTAHLDTAIALADRLGDPAVISSVRARQGYMLWWSGRHVEAIAVLEPRIRFASDSTAEEINSAVWLLNSYMVVGRYRSALELAPRLVERLAARGSVIHLAYAKGAWTWVLSEVDRMTDALALATANLEEARRSEDPAAVSFAAWSAARVFSLLGDFDRAEELADLSVSASVTPLDRIFSRIARGWVRCRAGRGEAALEELETATAHARAAKWPTPGGWLALPDAYAILGRVEDAKRSLEEHVEVATRLGMRATAAGAHRRLGDLALSRGDLEAARLSLETALAVFEEIGGSYEASLARASLAELARRAADELSGGS